MLIYETFQFGVAVVLSNNLKASICVPNSGTRVAAGNIIHNWLCKTEIAISPNSRISMHCTNEMANFSEMAILYANWPFQPFFDLLVGIILFKHKILLLST